MLDAKVCYVMHRLILRHGGGPGVNADMVKSPLGFHYPILCQPEKGHTPK
jgi:hypothetical protein